MVCGVKEVKLEETLIEIKPKSKHRIRNLCKEKKSFMCQIR